MSRKRPTNPFELREQTREWLERHTLQDVRNIARDLANAGEDVSELVDAINDLEATIRPDPVKSAHREAATAEA